MHVLFDGCKNPTTTFLSTAHMEEQAQEFDVIYKMMNTDFLRHNFSGNCLGSSTEDNDIREIRTSKKQTR